MRTFYLLLFGAFILHSCGENNSSGPANGNLDKTFNQKKPSPIPIDESSPSFELQKLGFERTNLKLGQMPDCYNFKPLYGDIENYLKINVGNTDVAIKLMNVDTDECIRFVYVNSNSSYSIQQIPEGLYYLKIAYGKEWHSITENGKCKGKFAVQPLYEKGTDILDFNSQGNSYSNYELSLDVLITKGNTFQSNTISEEDFNE